MRIEELELVVREAAAGVVEREGRPVPAAVVLPLPGATRVVTLPDFPPDDEVRHELLAHFVEDEMLPANAPCYGFVAEARAADGTDVVVAVFGARRHAPLITAAPLQHDGLGVWVEAEPLDAAAMPFLHPLQRAVDTAEPPDITEGLG